MLKNDANESAFFQDPNNGWPIVIYKKGSKIVVEAGDLDEGTDPEVDRPVWTEAVQDAAEWTRSIATRRFTTVDEAVFFLRKTTGADID